MISRTATAPSAMAEVVETPVVLATAPSTVAEGAVGAGFNGNTTHELYILKEHVEINFLFYFCHPNMFGQ